jgi:hypothetical protein
MNTAHVADSFLPQQKVYATKPKGHLRRTAKLDPVAEYFIYDLVYRNRTAFRPEVSQSRRSFGYRFKDGHPIPVHAAYKAYQATLAQYSNEYKFSVQFDIASYFNSIYHHDLSHWFTNLNGVSTVDSSAAGQFFREINAGRSVDFLPHGIYPCKMIGNEFLKHIDLHGTLKSDVTVRFMDDFTLFGNDEGKVRRDFIRIQQLLGNTGLNVNPSKTHFNKATENVDEKLSSIRESLKEIVSETLQVHAGSGIESFEVQSEVVKKLDSGQVASLVALLKDEALEENDADFILGFLRSHSDSALELIPMLLDRFPNLIKNIYTFCAGVTDKTALAEIVRDYAKDGEEHLEYQLF